MKRILLFTVTALFASSVNAQGQIGNSDMELWEAVASDEEPVNWNSFLTAQGTFSGSAANQIESSPNVRPGSTGTKSARIWSRSVFTIIANGNMTLGRINMESITPSDPSNNNISITADPDFSETLTDTPDSIVFWVEYNAASGSSNARMKATLHDDYDYTDPETGASASHIVATAEVNFPPTSGWVRMAIAFDYSGPASGNTHILVTFASNATPGGGSANDEVFVDDVTLIYNSTGGTDTDGDGVLDTVEATDATDPNDLCSFILASQTETPSATWNSTDCDFDGVSNAQEVINGTDPLVNNNASLNELEGSLVVAMDNDLDLINVISNESLNGTYAIYSTIGQVVQKGDLDVTIPFSGKPGLYFVHVVNNDMTYKLEIYKK